MSNVIDARRRIRELGEESQAILENKTFSNAVKKAKLDGLTAELKQHQDVIELSAHAKRLMGGGESGEGHYGTAIASGRAKKGLATPSLALTPEMQQSFYRAAKSGQNLRVELKDAASSDLTRTQLPASYVGLVDRKFEPTRILDHIPSTATSAPSVEFITHTANTVALAAPVLSAPTTATTGGTLAAGTYYYKATYTNTAGETVGSNEVSQVTTGATSTVSFTIGAAPSGATGTRVYRGTAAGAENVLIATLSTTPTSYTDTGAAGTNATVPTVDRTASAATIHAGGQYPETSLTTVATILTAKKLGIFTTVVDELLADFPTFSQYTEVELQRQITDAENWQLINGDGTGDNLLGLLKVTGTLSRLKGTNDTALDVIEQGITDLRNGPSFCEPDALIIHPSTWSTIRRSKNTLGNYVLGDPGQSTVSDVWGIPVLQTTQITPGVAVLGNLELATQAFIREGVTMQMTNSADSDFTSGKVKIRANERLMLGVSRPTALNVLTGL